MDLSVAIINLPGQHMDLSVAIASIVGLSGLVIYLTEGLSKLIEKAFFGGADKVGGVFGWVLSLVTSVGVSEGLAYLKLGIFSDPTVSNHPTYLAGLIVGVVVCLVANGIFSTDIAKSALTLLKVRVPVEEKK